MKKDTIIINETLLESISKLKRFKITAYDYFLPTFVCAILIAMFSMFCYSIASLDIHVTYRLVLCLFLFFVLVYALFFAIRAFINSFYFKIIVTNLKRDNAISEISNQLAKMNLSLRKSSNREDVLICLSYFSYSNSTLQTTIIVFDDYFLINTRNLDTAILSLHSSKIIDAISKHFKQTNKFISRNNSNG